MRYEQVPRPLTEDHYHIRELIERQEVRSEDRIYHRNKEKEREDRDNTIANVQSVEVIEFYCTDCAKDFKGVAVKQIEVDWTNSQQNIAFYKTKCWCGKWCMRLITDKHKDNYWFRSKAVARDRGMNFADTLQPHEIGFNMLYKKI